jgi:plastocyanin
MDAPYYSGGRRRAIAAAATVLVALALGLPGSAAHADRGGGASPSSAEAKVKIREFAFHPGKLTVDPGTTVVFANRDSVAHTAKRRGSFATGRIRPGHSASVRFGSSGVYAYHCTIHPEMHGKIVVG